MSTCSVPGTSLAQAPTHKADIVLLSSNLGCGSEGGSPELAIKHKVKNTMVGSSPVV